MINNRFRTLLVLAREKKYTRTAEICNISQPAVTQHIKALEEFYQVKIFKRVGKDLLITSDGKILIEEARRLLAINEGLKKKLAKDLRRQQKLDIGVTLTASNHFIPVILEVFKTKFPGTSYTVHTNNVEQIYQKLRLNELDFAVIDGTPTSKEFASKLLVKDELIFIAPSNHPFANSGEKISLEMLKKEKLILRDKKANTRIVFENFLLNHFESVQNFDIILEIESTSLIKRLVIEGHGISLISRAICQHLIDQSVLKELKVENFLLERGIYLIYSKEIEKDEIIQSILAL
ncbi:MAG: LysR family transcriptional regulator [Acholeplasmataceae bacterium]|jgi:DNA-binding transcriptional LysR family regulator|nr:LysR family transcriptional regulator [Acholeplasmataceae bacterium]